MDDKEFERKYGMTKAEFNQKYEVILNGISNIQKALGVLTEAVGEHYSNVYKMSDEVAEVKKTLEGHWDVLVKKMRDKELVSVAKGVSFEGAKEFVWSRIEEGMSERKDDASARIVRGIVNGQIDAPTASRLVKEVLRRERGKDYIS